MCAPMQIIVLFLVTVESSYVTVSIGEGMCVPGCTGKLVPTPPVPI